MLLRNHLSPFYHLSPFTEQDTYIKHNVVGDFVYDSFNEVFTYLPLGAVVKGETGSRVFLCHGGVPSQYLKPRDKRDSAWKVYFT